MALPRGRAAQLGGAQVSNNNTKPKALAQTLCQRRAGAGQRAVGDGAAGLWLMDGHSLIGLWHVCDALGPGQRGCQLPDVQSPAT